MRRVGQMGVGSGWRWVQALLILASVPVMAGEDEVWEMEPYRVEARHFDELGSHVAADVTRVERDWIEDRGSGGIPELLEALAGIQFSGVTGNGTLGQLAMRGFGDNSGLRVLVLVDGQAYNPADMGGINWLGMDLGDLETVEVIRGGQSVLYGNHALSGVVKLQTRIAEEGTEGSLRLERGSHDTRKAGLTWGQAIGENGIRLGVHREESDGYREHSQYENKGMSLAGRLVLGGAGVWESRISWNESDLYFPGPLEFDAMQADPRQSTNAGDEHSMGESATFGLNGSGKAEWGAWQLQSGYLGRDQEWSQMGRYSDSCLGRFNLSPRIKLGNDERFITLGADLQRDQLNYHSYVDPDDRIVRSWANLDRDTVGGYLFVQESITEQTALSGGIRLEGAQTDNLNVHYKENQLLPELETNRGTIPNPDYRNPPEPDPEQSFEGLISKSGWAAELSLLFTPKEGNVLWAGWDRVYRYPSLDETASYQGYPLSEPLNSNLEPETGNNLEIGLKRSANNWSASLTGFLLFLDNEIVYDDVLRLNTNVGKTERHGLEMEYTIHREKYGTSVRTTWTMAKLGKDVEGAGDRVPLVPEFHSVVMFWLQVFDSLRVQLNGSYRSTQFQGNDFDNAGRKLPAYGLVHCSLRWEPVQRIRLYMNVNNILDREYASTAYSGGFYPGSGRRFNFRIEYSF